jgi:hypothetical protein
MISPDRIDFKQDVSKKTLLLTAFSLSDKEELGFESFFTWPDSVQLTSAPKSVPEFSDVQCSGRAVFQ